MMAIEVEVKYRLSHPEEFRLTLTALGARLTRSAHEEDHYFNHPDRNFAVSDEALRIRRNDSRLFLTYKGPKMNGVTKTRREIELPVGHSVEDLPRLQDLIVALGFRPVATVEKRRDYWSVPWNNGIVEATIDQVEELGTFVELEMIAEHDALDACEEAVLTLASQLGLTTSIRESYLEMLLGMRA